VAGSVADWAVVSSGFIAVVSCGGAGEQVEACLSSWSRDSSRERVPTIGHFGNSRRSPLWLGQIPGDSGRCVSLITRPWSRKNNRHNEIFFCGRRPYLVLGWHSAGSGVLRQVQVPLNKILRPLPLTKSIPSISHRPVPWSKRTGSWPRAPRTLLSFLHWLKIALTIHSHLRGGQILHPPQRRVSLTPSPCSRNETYCNRYFKVP